MPNYVVKLSREVVVTYEAEVEVDAASVDEAERIAKKSATDAKIRSWSEVDSETQSVGVLSVELAYDEDDDDEDE